MPCLVILGHGGLLHDALLRGKEQVLILREVAAGDDSCRVLPLLERKQVHDSGAAGIARTHRQLMDLEAVHLAPVREEHDVVMRRGNEEILDEVVVLEAHAADALAAALLRAVGGNRQPLHVGGMGEGDDHVLFCDEVLNIEVLCCMGIDLRAPLVAVLVSDHMELVLDDTQDLLLVGKEVLVVGNHLVELLDLGHELVTRKTGKPAEPHLEDCLALDIVDLEALVHAPLCLCIIPRGADDVDDLVDVVDRDQKAFEDMDTLLRLVEVILRAPCHDVDPVLDVVVNHLTQRQRPRHAVHEGDINDTEVRLELGVLVEVVEHDLRHRTVLEVDDDAHALAVGLIAQVRDAFDLLLVHGLGNLLLEKALVDLIRDLGHDEALTPVLVLLDVHLGAQRDRATARLIGFLDAVGAHDDAACREVRAGEHLHELVGRDVGVVDHQADRIDGLLEVVGRHVCCHADSDAVRAIDKQVREARRQDSRLGERFVVVRLEIDCLLVEVSQHLHGSTRQTGFRVAHCCWGIAVDGAEVAMAVDEGKPHREVLCHADHCVVDGAIAVGMVLAHDLADGPCRLLVGLVRRDAGFIHGIEDAAVDRLQAIAHIREGAGHDDGHGVLEEGGLHLFCHVVGLERTAVDVGEVEAGACLIRNRVGEVGTGEVQILLACILFLISVFIFIVVAVEVIVVRPIQVFRVLVGVIQVVFELIAALGGLIVVPVACEEIISWMPVLVVSHVSPFARCRGTARPWHGSG